MTSSTPDAASHGRLRLWLGHLSLPLVVLAWGLFVVAPTWVQAARACFPNFDLGIYTQAFARLSFADPNPWLSGRQIFLFNDHFDPILWLAQPLTEVLPAMWAGLVAESLFVLLSLVPLLWLHARGLLSRASTVLAAGLLLLSVGAVDALRFPIHPTTWSVLPWVLAGVAFHFRRNGLLLVAMVLLFSCKEEFAFVGIMLAVALWLRGDRRHAVAALVLSVAWVAWVYGVRPRLWGHTQDHVERLERGLEEGWLQYLWLRVHPSQLARVGTLLVALAPLILWTWRERLRPDWAWMLVLLPLLGIRFLGMAWRFHYVAPLMAAALMGFLPVLRARRPPAWVLVSTFVLLITTNENNLRAGWRTLVTPLGFPARCPDDPARMASIARGVEWLTRERQGPALMGGNFVPLLAHRDDIFAMGGPYPADGRVFEWVLVEKPPRGEIWLLSAERIQELIALWRQDANTQVLIDDPHVFMAKGRFAGYP
ncbi:hypothetical protein MYSTI_00476 [Myxococcus stipitatus DSM 14675]|uniref:DUF2079 domain-containing protein n=1 Tax=Myxococcus stipitatus (strain DSM 14675 / JCM 12634 / Mx s8) TaxID=1278073 RepID=L7TZ80_MYXSD|nr:DUF2079 domain-containing protein [Myxococcus stipitatus]AGC41826.1 hypothetical protein MYSTI_00476 [Myxococcus stipitatus DSM 14675]